MKKTMKNVFAFALVLSLALGISSIPASAASIKGIVAPLTVTVGEDGNFGGSTQVSSWNESNIFSPDFNSYSVSADIYLPFSMFSKEGGSIFIRPMVQFWFPEPGVNGYLESDTEIVIGYDFENNVPFFKGLGKNDVETDDLPYLKSVTQVGDLIRVEIADAPVNSTLKSAEYGESGREVWRDPIPSAGSGDACPCFKVGSDRYENGSFAVANASVKIGDKEYKTDYSKKEDIAGCDPEGGEFSSLKASSFNTYALSVTKTSVKIKNKKSATVKVTTMFSGDKVTVSSSSTKVAKATYKSGKVTIKALKKGKATVSVKANGTTKKIKVTVK